MKDGKANDIFWRITKEKYICVELIELKATLFHYLYEKLEQQIYLNQSP